MSANCETPFWKNPAVLIQKFNINILKGCFESKANAFFRGFVLLLMLNTIIGFFIDNDSVILLLSIACLYGLMVYFDHGSDGIIEKFEEMASEMIVEEPFENGMEMESEEGFQADVPGATLPSSANPFMNVLVDEVKYNPTRGAAADIDCPMIQKSLDNFYRVQWWSDPTDVYGKNQGQRQFYTMPSTSVPSDRKSFQEWLFKIPGKTCKEGNRDACNPGSNGGVIPWLSQPN